MPITKITIVLVFVSISIIYWTYMMNFGMPFEPFARKKKRRKPFPWRPFTPFDMYWGGPHAYYQDDDESEDDDEDEEDEEEDDGPYVVFVPNS
jgi:hypothetical protein